MPSYIYLSQGDTWISDLIVGSKQLDCATVSPQALGIPDFPNRFGLPETDRANVVLIETRWFKWLAGFGKAAVENAFRRLEAISDVIIGVEGYATFRLGAPPEMLDRCAGLLKTQGIYWDRELYNHDVGAYFPGAQWTEPSRLSQRRYTAAQLEKLRLSLPCFVGADPAVRSMMRRARPETGAFARQLGFAVETTHDRISSALARARRDPEVCFRGRLTHLDRRDALLALSDAGIGGALAITGVPQHVFGVKRRGRLPLSDADRRRLASELAGRGLLTSPVPRLRMLAELRRHEIALGLAGYGELTFRHAEAWRAGAALICQDLSHVETMFPVDDRENAMFCRPDLEDLAARVRELTADGEQRERIARCGADRWRQWAARPEELVRLGITDPVAELAGGVGSAPPRPDGHVAGPRGQVPEPDQRRAEPCADSPA